MNTFSRLPRLSHDEGETLVQRIAGMTIDLESSTIRQAMQAIDRGMAGIALLAAPDGTFAGVVTDGDIRRALLGGSGLESPTSAVSRPVARSARIGTDSASIAAQLSDDVRVLPLLDESGRVADIAMLDKRLRIPVSAPFLGERELEYVTQCVLTGWISSAGEFVPRFEEVFAKFCGARYAVSASNGTTALHLALLGLGIGPGDEVIVPSLTFIASANAVRHTGADPVFVDVDPATWTIDPRAVEAAVTSRTRAIMPVHLFGHPADMDAINDIARRHGLSVVEDAAEAHGARYRGRPVGALGDAGVFSFYGNKIVTTGEGGMITTNDEELAGRMRVLRDHGMSPTRRYWHPVLGYNYRITNLQAAVGVAQMERVDAILRDKARIYAAYDRRIRELVGITPQPVADWASPVCWLYSVTVDSAVSGVTRDDILAELLAQGIETRPLFAPVHRQPIYNTGDELPVSDQLASCGMSLPSSVGLSDAEIDRVCRALAVAVGSRSLAVGAAR